ncbi:hypothetical protein Tco_0681475 [Tanacetum coccineum]|uniref:Uncharacterized protein n=1 Tax=Tanacetum coccineum TaxID=301880 RepID=A0ABQ4XP80_9ASTR
MTGDRQWEVILNGDSPLPTRTVNGVEISVPPTTAEQKLARKNELKARGTGKSTKTCHVALVRKREVMQEEWEVELHKKRILSKMISQKRDWFTTLKNQLGSTWRQFQSMSTQLTPPNVFIWWSLLLYIAALLWRQTIVVGCENDASIQKSNGLATLEKEMETRFCHGDGSMLLFDYADECGQSDVVMRFDRTDIGGGWFCVSKGGRFGETRVVLSCCLRRA